MATPVIFLAFANDQDAHLPLLEEERRAITTQLLPLANANQFQLYVEPSARITDLANGLVQFKDRIHLLHIGGHLDSGGRLWLSDQEGEHGIAQLLATLPNLKLVFLNGSSTKGQVQTLLEIGIPAVIATSVSIEDTSARDFANIFYETFAEDSSIEEAFNRAAASFQTRSGETINIQRSIGKERIDEEADPLPWGLYINEDSEEILRWKLPRKTDTTFILRGAGRSYSGRTINESLILTVANTIQEYSPMVQQVLTDARRRNPRLRDLRVAIIDSFPTPIGTHLRKLLLSEEVNTDRLQKIVNAYNVTFQFLSFILMSQLWDEKIKIGNLEMTKDQLEELMEFFALEKEQQPIYDYAQLIRTIGNIFVQNQIQPFLEEFNTFWRGFNNDGDFFYAYQFLEELKSVLQGTISADEIESFCVQAEDQLCEVFKAISFIAKYPLVSIKTIELEKRTFRAPVFKHNQVMLDRISASFGILDESFGYSEFCEFESVLLLRSEDHIHPYLNLSPFVVDENALTGQHNSKIYFLDHFKGPDTLYLLTDNLRDQLLVNEKDGNFPSIQAQLQKFKSTILA